MLVAVAGMSHRSAPIEVREQVAFAPCAARSFLRRLKDEGSVAEAVLLSTCNRTELYAVIEDEGARGRLFEALAAEKGVGDHILERHSYWLTDDEAVRHLYRVASSLDSMVVGEGQILGQVREAYRAATEELCTGPILNRLFHTSLRVGKSVRSETGLGDSSLSVPRVAVKLAEEVFGTLEGRKALVLGAGEMSGLVVKHLKSSGVREIRIANRTAGRAAALADRVGGVEVSFDSLGEELPGVDVVVSSTGSGEWVVGSELVAGALDRREDPLFFIDIAVPRDVDPIVQNLFRAYVYDVDDLVAPDALGAVPQLLDQRYDVQRREPAHVLQDGGSYHGLPCRRRRGSVIRVTVYDRLQVVHVVDVSPIQVLHDRVHVPRDRDVYKEQRILPPVEGPRGKLAPNDPLTGAGRADHHVYPR